ncbi:hypothetical protein ACLB2K_044604 [Fragaria x ananassa]
MAKENIVVSLEVMRAFKCKVRAERKLYPLDQLLWVVAVASNKEDEVIRCERERSKSQESGESSSSAVESLRKLIAMKVICKRRDESDDDHSHLGPELKKDNLDYFDSKDDHHHGDLGNKRNITSEKDEHATEYTSKNDDDDDNDDDWAFELRKRGEKRKGLKRKYHSPPSSHHQDLPEEHTRKKDLVFYEELFNSMDDDHSDLGKKKKMVSFNCKKQSSPVFESRRNCGIQIREPRRSYENDAEDKDFDFKKSKNKGKGLMMHREKKRVKYNSPPNTIHQDLVTFPSEKNELAVATEYIRKIDDDDDVDDNDWDSDLRKLEEKGKGLKRKFCLPPSSHHHDLPEDKKLFNSKGNDHGDLAKMKKMVSFNGKKQISSDFKYRKNYGIQIREPRKRSYENDAEDKDFDFKKSKNKGKGLMIHREKKRVKYNSPPCTIHQDLPENFKRKIETMGGDSNKAQLVLQKRLYKSDIEKQQNRLSLPMNQLLCNFLEPDEVRRLENTEEFMDITIIDPMGEEEPVCFKKWTYKETVKSYVLITQWSGVAKKNGLEPGDLIQVWSFRDRENNLHLAVVRRDESSDGSAAGCSSGSNAANASTSAVGAEGSSNANTSSVGGEGSSGDHAKEDGITVGVLVEKSRSKGSSETSMEYVD